jgi:CHAT domain-containing protein
LTIARVAAVGSGSSGARFDPTKTAQASVSATQSASIRDMVQSTAPSASAVPEVKEATEGGPSAVAELEGSDPGALLAVDEELELLRSLEVLGVRVERLPAQRQAVRQAFENGTFHLLHLVSHGYFGGSATGDASGVLLEDGVFTAAELSPRMAAALRRASPLVVFNTCHSGRIGFSLTRLGSWGAQLVQLGCGGFVGALWPVSDRGALAFARAFYDHLARRCPLGEAVRLARHRTREQFPDDPTWLAYACYADPLAQVEPAIKPDSPQGCVLA